MRTWYELAAVARERRVNKKHFAHARDAVPSVSEQSAIALDAHAAGLSMVEMMEAILPSNHHTAFHTLQSRLNRIDFLLKQTEEPLPAVEGVSGLAEVAHLDEGVFTLRRRQREQHDT